MASTAGSSDCVDYAGLKRARFPVTMNGRVHEVARSGDLAFFAAFQGGMHVFDVSDPRSPRLVASATSGLAEHVAADGDRVFVTATYPNVLRAFDVSTPSTPVPAGSLDLPNRGLRVAAASGRAYVLQPGELLILDVQGAPKIVGSVALSSVPHDVAVSGDYAFVADGGAGLVVVDVATPEHAAIVATLSTGEANGVVIEGGHAYVANGSNGLWIVDVSDPESPGVVSMIDTYVYAYGVSLRGGVAYVVAYNGMAVVDVSSPTGPNLDGLIGTPSTAAPSIVVVDHYAIVAAGPFSGSQVGLAEVIDIVPPPSPPPISRVATQGDYNSRMAMLGDFALVSAIAAGGHDSGLNVVDIDDPENPRAVGWIEFPSDHHYPFSLGVAVSGGYAFVTDGTGGTHVVDVSDPTSPLVARTIASGAFANGVAASDGYVYIADGPAGLAVVDATDPLSATVVGTVATPGGAYGVAVRGDYAYLADWGAGLQVIDVGDPAQPSIVGTVDTPHLAHDVAVADAFAFLVDGNTGLVVIDVSDPTKPDIVAIVDTPGEAVGVDLSGDVAYVADFGGSLQVISIRDPRAPLVLGPAAVPNVTVGAIAAGDIVYVETAGSLEVIQAQCGR